MIPGLWRLIDEPNARIFQADALRLAEIALEHVAVLFPPCTARLASWGVPEAYQPPGRELAPALVRSERLTRSGVCCSPEPTHTDNYSGWKCYKTRSHLHCRGLASGLFRVGRHRKRLQKSQIVTSREGSHQCFAAGCIGLLV